MSTDISTQYFSDFEISKLKKRLSFIPPKTIYNDCPTVKMCYNVNHKNRTLTIPISIYGELTGLKYPNGEPDTFENMNENATFVYDLHTSTSDIKQRDQDVVAREAISQLKNTGTTFISANTGFGKCLDPDTFVLMADGRKKKAKNIQSGDMLMGDDGGSRTAVGVCSGEEEMFEILSESLDGFICNKSHILTLYTPFQCSIRTKKSLSEGHYNISWFNGERFLSKTFSNKKSALLYASKVLDNVGSIFDVPLELYLSFSKRHQQMFRVIWIPIEYVYQPIPWSVEEIVLHLLDIKKIPNVNIGPGIPECYIINSSAIRNEFICCAEKWISGKKYLIQSAELANDLKSMCFSVGIKCKIIRTHRGYHPMFDRSDANIVSDRFDVFSKGIGRYCGFSLDGNGRFLLGNYMVTHNTALGIYLSTNLKLKTAVITHSKAVREQWNESFNKFTNGTVKVQMVRGKSIDPRADVYLMGIQKAANMKLQDLISIGTVVIDECHVATETAFTQSLLNFRPCYLIGLSATPDRPDKLHCLFQMYFGNEFIRREETKKFQVFKYSTPFKPKIEYTVIKGKTVINWNTVISSIENNELRWKIIADIVSINPNEKILVLSRRVAQSKGIYSILKSRGESIYLFTGKASPSDKTQRVTIASIAKAGIGFDDPKLTMLIIASDTADVRQYEGRLRTTNCTIYDIVDKHPSFERHWKLRKKWYIKRGAVINDDEPRDVDKGELNESKRFLKRNV